MEQIKYQGKFLKITEEEIEDKIFERVYLPSGVIIFPFNEAGEIYMIQEHRPHETPTTRFKFVTGHVEEGEDPLLTANRELQEEIGQKAKELTLLHHHQSNGTVNNNVYFVQAKGLSPNKIPNPDGEETILAVISYPLTEIVEMFNAGNLDVSFPVRGLLKFFQSYGYGIAPSN